MVGIVGDLEQEGNAPAATGAGAETLRHPAGSTRPDAPAVVDQLPQGNVVAVANVVVEIHGTEVISCQLSVISYQLSVVSCQLSAFGDENRTDN